MSGFTKSFIKHKQLIDEAKIKLSKIFNIDISELQFLQLNAPECDAILNDCFISLPIIKDANKMYHRFDEYADRHFTGIRIEDECVYIEERKFFIDSRFFDENSIREYCRKNRYDCN